MEMGREGYGLDCSVLWNRKVSRKKRRGGGIIGA